MSIKEKEKKLAELDKEIEAISCSIYRSKLERKAQAMGLIFGESVIALAEERFLLSSVVAHIKKRRENVNNYLWCFKLKKNNIVDKYGVYIDSLDRRLKVVGLYKNGRITQ